MANGTHSVVSQRDYSAHKVTWPLTTADHTGAATEAAEYQEKSIQLSGTWGGATAIVEGSNDGVTFAQLHDKAGNLISLTANGLVEIEENVVFIRPRLSVVGAGAEISAIMLLRRQTPARQ